MDYSFFVRIEITTRAAYSNLSEAQRAEARDALLAQVAPVARRLGTFATATPGAFLRQRIAADPGGSWSVGSTLEGLDGYYFDDRIRVWVCESAYVLMKADAPFAGQVEIGGQTVGATFTVLQTAQN